MLSFPAPLHHADTSSIFHDENLETCSLNICLENRRTCSTFWRRIAQTLNMSTITFSKTLPPIHLPIGVTCIGSQWRISWSYFRVLGEAERISPVVPCPDSEIFSQGSSAGTGQRALILDIKLVSLTLSCFYDFVALGSLCFVSA